MGQRVKRKRGRAGQRQRERRLALYPLCVDCIAEGRVTATEEINHIIPLDEGGLDTDENTEGLCKPHHLIKTHAQNARRHGNHGYDAQGKPNDPDHPWSSGH